MSVFTYPAYKIYAKICLSYWLHYCCYGCSVRQQVVTLKWKLIITSASNREVWYKPLPVCSRLCEHFLYFFMFIVCVYLQSTISACHFHYYSYTFVLRFHPHLDFNSLLLERQQTGTVAIPYEYIILPQEFLH